jgi:tetratricopeptide (TPR) repeat protein
LSEYGVTDSVFFQKGKNEMKLNFRNQMFLAGFAFVTISLAYLAPAWAYRANECGDQKPEVSLAACTQMITANKLSGSKKWEVFKNRGTAFRMLKNYKLAIADFDEGLNRLGNKKTTDTKNARSTLLTERGLAKELNEDKSGALADYNSALQNNPRNHDTFYQRGRYKFSLGDYASAVEDFTHGIEISPKSENIYYWRANSYDNLGKFREAIADYNQAIAIYPQDEKYYYDRAIAYAKHGDIGQARADYEKAISIAPKYQNAIDALKKLDAN